MIKCFYWSASALLLLFSMLVAGQADTDQDRSSALTPGQGRPPIGGEMITWGGTALWLVDVAPGFVIRTILPIQLKLPSKHAREIRNKKQFSWCFAKILLNLSGGAGLLQAEGEESLLLIGLSRDLMDWWGRQHKPQGGRLVPWPHWGYTGATWTGYTTQGSWLGAHLNNVLRPTRWVNQV